MDQLSRVPDSVKSKEPIPMLRIPIESDVHAEVGGEIDQSKAEDVEGKRESTLDNKVESTVNSFSAYIARMAKERGGQMPVAEASSIYSNDLLPGLRGKSFSEGEEHDLEQKMGGTGFYDTGKTITIPTNEGEATFNLVAVSKAGKSKLTLEPGAYSDIAQRIAGN
ncbi:MAG: hypothetical protein A2534_05330 [Candidatus Magasanikbacteria bacterium RIFOXYD2_FULL_39_9]|uniref:Uncharacterized protein n=1 Tax=Candidatus Magasanikbacteria bacterium RIFOXYD1_FULL_40_23 TaxID=1798705 RepID=A0A1F6P948_9BACT|nr:MAG: hypothetical protein A2534_05330 [Candidatus Magasanikbacteria bacterium RIFOXYD2_FULL_39_9]OGH92682.1 MAG: hypothetical protein A2563_03345 [Candidatus Magasanikbacteria bacterium RIFOXYD1_FULL_40_23]